MPINYFAIIVCAVLSMVLGFVWYGPLFGKFWMRLNDVTPEDMAARKEMQKKAMPLYLIQIVLTLFQVWVLAHLTGFTVKVSVISGFLIWAAFIMPTQAGMLMWSNKPRRIMIMQFLLQAGFQLVLFLVFGLILGLWH